MDIVSFLLSLVKFKSKGAWLSVLITVAGGLYALLSNVQALIPPKYAGAAVAVMGILAAIVRMKTSQSLAEKVAGAPVDPPPG
jgi:hypothetical protein